MGTLDRGLVVGVLVVALGHVGFDVLGAFGSLGNGVPVYECSGNAFGLRCVFTNTSRSPTGALCLQGGLQADSGRGRLNAAVLCSGSLPARTTVSLEAPWVGGAVADVCKSTKTIGDSTFDQLDWSKCTLELTAIQ